MLKVTLKNGNEYELLEDTTVYPSGSPNARSRMEIHMGEDAMTTADKNDGRGQHENRV